MTNSLTRWNILWFSIAIILLLISIRLNWESFEYHGLYNVDIHREMTVPLRIMNGEVLYRDFNFLYGPLPPHVNTIPLSFNITSPMNTLRSTALFIFLLSSLTVIIMCRSLPAKELVGPSICCWFAWTATSPYMLNPSSFNAIYTALFASAGVIAAMHAAKSGKTYYWLLLGLFGALAALSKPEGAFTIALAASAAILIELYKKKKILAAVSSLIYILLAALIVIIPFTLYCINIGMSLDNLIDGLLQSRFQTELSRGYIGQFYYFWGLKGPITLAAGILGCTFILFIYRWWDSTLVKFIGIFALILLVCFAVLGRCHGLINDFLNFGIFFSSVMGWWWIHKYVDPEKRPAYYVLWAAGLAAWLRPYLHVGALIFPFARPSGCAALVIALVFWKKMLPDIAHELWQKNMVSQRFTSRFFTTITVFGVILYSGVGVWDSYNRNWRHSTYRFKTSIGNVQLNNSNKYNKIWFECLNYLKANLKENERIVGIEDAAGFELALGFLPALPITQGNYQVYPGDAERIINTLESRQDIRYVVIYINPNSNWNFGVQCCKFADYLTKNWYFEKTINIPEKLNSLSLMSPERKQGSMDGPGFIIFARK